MGTIFVAYGSEEGRREVLETAAERASQSGDDLFVHHVQESHDESADGIREEVAAVMERTAPEVPYEVTVDTGKGESDRTNVSNQKRLVDAILEGDRDVEYVVMGNVEHGPVESLTLASNTQAVLKTRKVPVLLVPV